MNTITDQNAIDAWTRGALTYMNAPPDAGPMFESVDHLEGPLTADVAWAIATAYPESVAHLLILRRARNLCWNDWHAHERTPYKRSQSQLAYKILQHTIDAETTKAINDFERKST